MESFHQEMDRRFGTEPALGVVLVIFDRDGNELMKVNVEDIGLLSQRIHDKWDFQSQFADGTDAICCTNYAGQILKAMPDRVKIYGFANENNPTSRVARQELHPGGHDFAVVDDRFIVDPWPRLILLEEGPMVFDMQDPVEAALALDTYGPRTCWVHMAVAEVFALTGELPN